MMYNNILRQNIGTILLQQEVKKLKKLVKIKKIPVYVLYETINEKDKNMMNMSNRKTVTMKILNKGDNKFFVIE